MAAIGVLRPDGTLMWIVIADAGPLIDNRCGRAEARRQTLRQEGHDLSDRLVESVL